MAKILVTGGAGYIGSHTCVDLIQHGYEVVLVDNFSNSFEKGPIESIIKVTNGSIHTYQTDLRDYLASNKIFEDHPDIVGIIHFAALKAVGESTEEPILYFDNNISSLNNILQLAAQYEVSHFIFSSSCTVYGQADELPVTESTPLSEAESPYGRTKQIGEMILQDVARYTDINVISLRYFNPAGAHHSGYLGESSKKVALNLVPVITETAAGLRPQCIVFGNDYDTRDGSCVRDYIHVEDLAHAHKLALDYLLEKKNTEKYEIFNLGIGNGVTVLEAIEAFESVCGQKLNYKIGPRRSGDIVAIYSNYDRASKLLHWSPQYGIEDIMKTAWYWQQHKLY